MKLLFLLSFTLLAQKPPAIPADKTSKEVQDFIRATAEDLQNKDVQGFLEHFDGKMPGFEMLHYYVEGLAARDAVLSSIEVPADQVDKASDGQKRTLKLDWILSIDSERARRQVVNVTIEKQGKKWKIIALEPIDFFKPPAF